MDKTIKIVLLGGAILLVIVLIVLILKKSPTERVETKIETKAENILCEILDADTTPLDQLTNNELINIILFHSPQCPHCVTTKPHFRNLANELDGQKYKLIMADVTKNNQSISAIAKGKPVPMIKRMRNGQWMDEGIIGSRGYADLLTYATS